MLNIIVTGARSVPVTGCATCLLRSFLVKTRIFSNQLLHPSWRNLSLQRSKSERIYTEIKEWETMSGEKQPKTLDFIKLLIIEHPFFFPHLEYIMFRTPFLAIHFKYQLFIFHLLKIMFFFIRNFSLSSVPAIMEDNLFSPWKSYRYWRTNQNETPTITVVR